jgi:HD superfamily phosphodiesterase
VLDEFFSKFLTLDEVMTTRTGRVLAQRRIAFLRLYLQELQRELEEGNRGRASLERWLTAS